MKKQLHIFLFLFIVLSLGACHKKPQEINYDASMLYGKWQEGSVYEHYYDSLVERVLPSGDTVYVNGTTWDVSDDVTEDEAQLFNWTLTGATLKQVHVGTFIVVPKLYTVTSLNNNELSYRDEYGMAHYFTKVE
jgi:hypothetical protein